MALSVIPFIMGHDLIKASNASLNDEESVRTV